MRRVKAQISGEVRGFAADTESDKAAIARLVFALERKANADGEPRVHLEVVKIEKVDDGC